MTDPEDTQAEVDELRDLLDDLQWQIDQHARILAAHGLQDPMDVSAVPRCVRGRQRPKTGDPVRTSSWGMPEALRLLERAAEVLRLLERLLHDQPDPDPDADQADGQDQLGAVTLPGDYVEPVKQGDTAHQDQPDRGDGDQHGRQYTAGDFVARVVRGRVMDAGYYVRRVETGHLVDTDNGQQIWCDTVTRHVV